LVTQVLMSVHPRYAEAILEGKKRYEIRRARPQFPPGTIVWLYATKPRSAIVGWFESGEVISAEPRNLWLRFSETLCIEPEAFEQYVSGRDCVSAIEIRDVQAMTDLPMPRGLMPPQSYRYLAPSIVQSLRLSDVTFGVSDVLLTKQTASAQLK
jgi:predicted transcriptional regulator